MIITIIITMIVLSGIGATSYLTINSLQTANQNNAILQNQRKATEIKDLLVNDIHRINNSSEFFTPVGDNTIADYTSLPSFLGNKRFTAGGVPFLYCPTSGSATPTGSEVTLPDFTTYSISTINNPAKAGYEYVNGSSLKVNDVLAFIVSPLGNKSTMPSCEDITYTQGNYIVGKGQVFAITEMDLLSHEQNASIIEARVNETYTNDSSLEDGTEVKSKSLITNIERFKSSTINEMIVYLEAGTYDIPSDVMVDVDQKGKKLTFVGNGSVVINTPDIDFKGVDISFKNVDTVADVAINSSRFTLDGAEVGSVTATGADIRAIESNVVGSTTLTGSSLVVTDAFDFGQVQLFSGSSMDIVDANGTIIGSSVGIGVLGSKVSIDNSTVEIGGSTAINNQGELVVWNSTVTSQGGSYGVLSSNGGINRVSNSDMFVSGTLPSYAFFDDNGTALVAGNGNFGGIQCVEGEVFDDLATITTTDSTTHTVPNPNNQAEWTCL